ncbi:hypothetical protein Tco_1002489 [Tanacetum coccineum]|uniref:Retrotransposon gag domain-containing protein n=1 Tax=Tanacetum coccineum TaxID=301880 RepID=A0ABQ5F6E8_9ASTR
MAGIKTETTMDGFVTNDRANYYSRITRIMVNGKNAYELKGKFLDDFLDNAFSGTNREDAVEHIEYFLKIVDPINLPNVNYEGIRLAIFPISLVGNASKWFDEFKVTKAIRDPNNSTFEKWLAMKFANHMMMDPFTKKVLWDFWKKSGDQDGGVDEAFFDEFNFLLKVDPELFTRDIERTKTYEDNENELNDENEEPQSKDEVPYEMCDHICEPFRFKNGKAKWPTCNSNEDGFCNGGELPGMVQVGYITYFQDYEWYNELADGNLKEEVLKQKAIYERSWGDASKSIMKFCAWLKTSFGNFHELDYELLVKLQDYYIFGMNNNTSNMSNVQEEEHNERCNLFNDIAHNAPVCKIRIFDMIKYSFRQDEEYVAIKECEYDDLTKTNEDACRAYQEIFRSMDEGWVVTRA